MSIILSWMHIPLLAQHLSVILHFIDMSRSPYVLLGDCEHPPLARKNAEGLEEALSDLTRASSYCFDGSPLSHL
jgi:hypothetical protein